MIYIFFLSKSHRKETKKVIGQLPLHTIKHGEKVPLLWVFLFVLVWFRLDCMSVCLSNVFQFAKFTVLNMWSFGLLELVLTLYVFTLKQACQQYATSLSDLCFLNLHMGN